MSTRPLHRFEHAGKRYVIDPQSCFCFECDEISWDVLEFFPEAPVNQVFHLLRERYALKELEEVIGELEWLRASKSILTPPRLEQQQKAFELDRGLRRIEVHLDRRAGAAAAAPVAVATSRGKFSLWTRKGAAPDSAPQASSAAVIVRDAAALLLARGVATEALRLELRVEHIDTLDTATLEALANAQSLAALAGKTLHVVLSARATAGAPGGHTLYFRVVAMAAAGISVALDVLRSAIVGTAAASAAFGRLPEGCIGETEFIARALPFADAVDGLYRAGLRVIHLDFDPLYSIAGPDGAAAIAEELRNCAQHYAKALVRGDYYRLEPIAGLFHRIYLGMAQPRSDAAGLWSLAIDATGAIFPSRAFFDNPAHRIAALRDTSFEPALLARYEDIGSLTTPACMKCWARNLCGGGSAAIHEALSGHYHEPHPAWCDAQRAWAQTAIAAFNLLSNEGVGFARIYGQLAKTTKPSLFTLVRAAFQVNIGLRPIGEPDAELLTRWQNFSDAAYFTFNESGLLLATRYDREMDALHPQAHEFEFLLLRKNGDPLGLLRLRPLTMPGMAQAWIYLRATKDYADEGVRKSFRFLLDEAAKRQGLERLLVATGPFDAGLPEFLAAVGFIPSGSQRAALFLRGTYHDVAWHSAELRKA